jgi:PAS domain-containing protein
MPSSPRDATLLERENENLRAQLASVQAHLLEATAHIETLRQSEAAYRSLHQARLDAFARTTLDGRIEEANEPFCRMVGYSEQELRSMTWRDLTPERWHEAEVDIVRREVVARGRS